jgi:flavin-dependent dehydrogenase
MIIVAGGGLAGGASACALAQAGRPVTLIERDRTPVDKICGEFLSIEAQESLAALGLDVVALGGHPIDRLRLIRGRDAVAVDLPFTGMGLTRKRLDAALLDHAQRAGVDVRRGIAIRRVEAGGALALDLADGTRLEAATLLLATGKHEVRGISRPVAAPGDLVGFKMYFRLNPTAQAQVAAHIELFLYDRGYAGLQLVEGGIANLCLLVARTRLAALGGSWAALLADLQRETPILAERLAGATPLLDQALTIARVPYGYSHRPTEEDPAQLFRLGDQAGVIHSFTGDGMAIALHSAALAATAITNGLSSAQYHQRLRRDIAGQISRASLLYRAQRSWPAQRVLFALAQRAPFALRLVARYTRVPLSARHRLNQDPPR